MLNQSNTKRSIYDMALTEMRSKGFNLNDLEADGKIHRFSRDNNRDKNSWYVCFKNTSGTKAPFLAVAYGDWSDGDGHHKYSTPTSDLSREEKEELRKQFDSAITKAKEEQDQNSLLVSSQCQEKWETLSPTGFSEYLERKKLSGPFGARFEGDNLVIPCLDEKGTIWSFQTIYPNGEKRFLKGGKKSGTFFNIGELSNADRFYIAEGFATGVSIHLATQVPVVIAFDCGNLVRVAELLKKTFPKKKIDICGDDDQWSEKNGQQFNPGRNAAKQAADIVGGRALFPIFKNTESRPTDFNDLHFLEGLDAVRSQLFLADSEQVLEQAEEQKKPKSRSQATELINLAKEVELFHNPEGDAFASIVNNGHKETWSLTSKDFSEWLSQQYYKKHRSVCSSQATREAIDTLRGMAKFEGAKKKVYLRIAEEGGTIYLDLCNDNWDVIEIDKNGWRKSKNHEIKFRRSGGMSSLPLPVPCNPKEGIEKLRQFINVEDVQNDANFQLVVAFLLSSLQPCGPYMALVLYGEQGTGKSTMVRVLRSLIDPNQAPLRKSTKTTDDLMVMAKHNFMIVADNLSYLNDDLSDDFCRLATGGALTKRQHYTDDQEITLEATRPIILNGIDEFVYRGDLVSRSIVINLPVIGDKKRETEKAFNARFEKAKPEILGALLSAVSEALKNQESLKMEENQRMADAWHWISAGVSAFGWQPQEIIKHFKESHDEVSAGILEGSPLYGPLMKLVDEPQVKFNKWHKTPTETLQKLGELLSDDRKTPKGWPSSSRVLSSQLKRLAPQLRCVGIGVELGKSKTRFIEIWKSTASIDASDATTQVRGLCVEGDADDDRVPF